MGGPGGARPGAGRPRSPERIALETVPCNRCGAAPGQPCRNRSTGASVSGGTLAHAARSQAQALAAGKR